MPEYRCYWRVNPDTKVAVAFGPMAASRYGTDMTLWSALQGRGDPYRTLLREGTTALLNSYNSIQFAYHTLGVIHHMNWALVGSPQQVLLAALRFKRANSGYGHVSCKFTPCKWFFISTIYSFITYNILCKCFFFFFFPQLLLCFFYLVWKL